MILTGLRAWCPAGHQFSTSFVLDLVAMSVFPLKLRMLVITKALLSLYNIELWNINKACNTKDLCVFKTWAQINLALWPIYRLFYW